MRSAIYDRAAAADLIVMVAAVADFRPKVAHREKVKRAAGMPAIELVENPDILAGLPERAPQALRVGFAAETEPSVEEAYAKLRRKGVDFLVWNDVARSDIGFGAEHNEATVYRRAGETEHFPRRTKRELASDLMRLFGRALEERERSLAGAAG